MLTGVRSHDICNVDTVNFMWQVHGVNIDCREERVVFYRLGLKIVARARLVLAGGVLALVVSAVLGVGAFARLLSGGFDDPASASSQAKV